MVLQVRLCWCECSCSEDLQERRLFLEKSIQFGVNYIVTNAGEGWVQYSAKKFMPSVEPLLKHIKVISARSKYES